MNTIAIFYLVLAQVLMTETSSLFLHNKIIPFRSKNSLISSFLRGFPEDQTQKLDNLNSTDSESSLLSCPFSKSFPRYRIELKKTKKDRKNYQNLVPIQPFFIPWKKSMQIERIKRKYNDDDGSNRIKLIIKPDVDEITAFATLWKEAAEMMRVLHNKNSDDSNSSNDNGYRYSNDIDKNKKKNDDQFFSLKSSTVSVAVALPDASMDVVQNFCEIVNWMSSYIGSDYILEAFMEEGCEFPVARLEMRVQIQMQQYQNNLPLLRKDPSVINVGNINNDQQIALSNTISTRTCIDESKYEKIINERTRQWVQRLLVALGICPFTRSNTMSGQGLTDMGVKAGSIAYHASFQTHPIGLFADTWDSIDRMIKAGPEGKKGVSSILLAAPAFDDDFDTWSGPIFAMLEASVVAVNAESKVGVVCFHPRYATPDGKSWPGFGQMHSVPKLENWYRDETSSSSSIDDNKLMITTDQIAAGGAWQRRTPHATINVLRADQLEMAESRRTSRNLYTENIDKIVRIGNNQLAEDLERERQLSSINKKNKS